MTAELDQWRRARLVAQVTQPLSETLPEKCSRCESTEGVKLESSRTAYHWDGTGEDPNAPVLLCRECAEEHHSYWDEMWSHVAY